MINKQRYIKCNLTLDTREEFDLLLNLVDRAIGTASAGDEYRKNAKGILDALQYHYDSCGFS